MPTDCPTREKHGWMGDALDASEQAMYNFDTQAMHSAFIQTIEDNQVRGTALSSAKQRFAPCHDTVL